MYRLACLFSTIALIACGGDSPGDDPGTGTGTLLIDGTVTAEPTVPNSGDATNFATEITARITRDGLDVIEGTVQVHSDGGSVNLLFDTALTRWRGAQAGYYEVYTLDVTSGTDAVTGVRVDGPDIHTITAPSAGATVDSTMPVPVTWARAEEAEVATVRTREINAVTITDTGEYSLAMGTLKSKPDETENEEVEIVRASTIAPTGALPGSSFRVRIRNVVEVVVQPTP